MKVEMARLKVAMMSALKNKEAEVEEKDRQTENMQHNLRQMQVRCTHLGDGSCFETPTVASTSLLLHVGVELSVGAENSGASEVTWK